MRAKEVAPGKWNTPGTGESVCVSGLDALPVLPFKRQKSIMLRTLDIFSMIVIVAAAVFSARWQAHYSARGATVTAVATIHRRVIYPVFGYPLLLVLLPAAYTRSGSWKGAGRNLFGERSGFALFRRQRVTSDEFNFPPAGRFVSTNAGN